MTKHPAAIRVEPPKTHNDYLKVYTYLPLFEESEGFDLEAVDSLCEWAQEHRTRLYGRGEARIYRVRA
jgi:hypothetical protein